MNLPRTVFVTDASRWQEAQEVSQALEGSLVWSADDLSGLVSLWSTGAWDMVLPLAEVSDGNLQGSLEFLGIPYAGCSLTATILAHQGRYLGQPSTVPAHSKPITVALVSSLSFGSSHPEAVEAALEASRLLGLNGAALVEVAVPAQGPCQVTAVHTSPDLRSGSTFAQALEHGGSSVTTALGLVVVSGLERHHENSRLVSTFRDQL